ncbi:hypothetical protein A2U01_0107892, partial [Trifolium medium]|nr:hypothetical protein [Trifolium medium]
MKVETDEEEEVVGELNTMSLKELITQRPDLSGSMK